MAMNCVDATPEVCHHAIHIQAQADVERPARGDHKSACDHANEFNRPINDEADDRTFAQQTAIGREKNCNFSPQISRIYAQGDWRPHS